MAQTMTTRARTPRPSADGTRERILAAALDLFSEVSFDGATTRDIAARAGVTQGSVNYHFSSKDELWRAAVDGLFAELGEALDGRADGPARRRRADHGEAADPRVHRLLGDAPAAPPDHHPGVQERRPAHGLDGRAPHPAPVRADDRAVHPAGRGRSRPDIPVEHLYYILTGAGPTMFVLAPECRRLSGVDPQAPDVVEAHADAVLSLLFGADRKDH